MIFLQKYFVGTIVGERFGAAFGDSFGEIVGAVIIDYVVGERLGGVVDDNVDFCWRSNIIIKNCDSAFSTNNIFYFYLTTIGKYWLQIYSPDMILVFSR